MKTCGLVWFCLNNGLNLWFLQNSQNVEDWITLARQIWASAQLTCATLQGQEALHEGRTALFCCCCSFLLLTVEFFICFMPLSVSWPTRGPLIPQIMKKVGDQGRKR